MCEPARPSRLPAALGVLAVAVVVPVVMSVFSHVLVAAVVVVYAAAAVGSLGLWRLLRPAHHRAAAPKPGIRPALPAPPRAPPRAIEAPRPMVVYGLSLTPATKAANSRQQMRPSSTAGTRLDQGRRRRAAHPQA